eukprot:708561-Pyramimonas_sp.AAC.1
MRVAGHGAWGGAGAIPRAAVSTALLGAARRREPIRGEAQGAARVHRRARTAHPGAQSNDNIIKSSYSSY